MNPRKWVFLLSELEKRLMTDEKVILNKRIQVYLSDEAREALIRLMGQDGRPSETINQVIIEADHRVQKELNKNAK